MKSFFLRVARSLLKKYTATALPKFLVMVMDLRIVIFSYCFFVFVKYYKNLDGFLFIESAKELSSILLVFFLVFIGSGSCHGLLRYSGFNDIMKIGRVCIGAFIILYISKFFLSYFWTYPLQLYPSYSEMFFLCLIIFIILTFSRLIIKRIYNEYLLPHPKTNNVVIYGAGDAAPITQNALYQDTSCQYNIVAFVDDSPLKIGKTINDIQIYKPNKILNKDFIKKEKIHTLIIAIPSLDIKNRQRIINAGLELDLNVKAIPHFNNWINGQLTANQIEDIKIEDLLERDPIVLGKENVINYLKDKIVMVTGAAGSIGSEICRQVLYYCPKKLIMLDQAESPLYDFQFELNNNEQYKALKAETEFIIANVKDGNKMEEIFKHHQPQVIYHAAAYKHVPLMENFPYEAVYVNVLGTKNIVDMAIKYHVEKFVMISTDKAVNPTNVMGASKRIAEIYTQSRESSVKFVTTRFGTVLGSNGSVIPLFKKQLAKGGPLTVTHKDIIRYFMTIPEACSLVLEAGAIGDDKDIFVFDMGKPVKIYDLAKKMITLSRIPNIQIEITGLRPGEKLYEELLANKENTCTTENPKIMRAKVKKYTKDNVDPAIKELMKIASDCNDFKIVEKMKQIVPEFISNNSIYTVLDNH